MTTEDNYKNTSSYIEVLCKNKHYQKVKFEVFKKRRLNGKNTINKCFECFNEHRLNIAKERAYELGYILHSNTYTGVDSNIELTCNKGHKWTTTYDRFVRIKNLCLECNNILLSMNQRLPFSEVRKRIEVEGYKLLSSDLDYENNESILDVECAKGHVYKVALNNFQQGKRCPKCIQSKGENKIEKVLNELNIQYVNQYRFKDCKYKYMLPFDFYLPKYNLCIEYDGQQHFEEGRFGYSKSDFEELKLKDQIKTNYCLDNNIKLIRIPYWEFDNIENILKTTFNLEETSTTREKSRTP